MKSLAELKSTIKKLIDSGFQLTWRERNAVMAALIGQKLHTERPQLTVEELATRARQQTAEQTKNETRAVLSAGPSSSRYKEIRTHHGCYREIARSYAGVRWKRRGHSEALIIIGPKKSCHALVTCLMKITLAAIAPNKTLVVARLAGIAPSNAAGSGD